MFAPANAWAQIRVGQHLNFFVIIPKTDIMLASAAVRAAIQRLTELLPTLQSQIEARAGHGDVCPI